MIEAKVSIRGAGRSLDLSQFLGNSDNMVDDVLFRVNDGCEDADVWFVLEEPEDDDGTCRVPPSNVFFLTAETSWPAGHYAESPARMAYLRQFSRVFTCHDVYLDSVTYDLPFLPWMVNANHGASMFAPHERDVRFLRDQSHIDKSALLSVFCSTQTWTAPHRMRLRFVERLKDHFGDSLDWFGNGIRSVPEKWQGLAPYRYTIVLENRSSPNVITEKIQDAFLALSYPLYWGAPNVSTYFPQGSLTTIDIKDLKGSLAVIERILADDPYEIALPHLRESKRRVVDEMNLFVRMARIAREAATMNSDARTPVALSSISDLEARSPQPDGSLTTRTGRLLERVGRRLQR